MMQSDQRASQGDFGRLKEIRRDRQAKKVQAVIDAKSPPGLTACVLQACERNNDVRRHHRMYMQMGSSVCTAEAHSVDFNAGPNLRDVMRPKIPLRVKGPLGLMMHIYQFK